MSALVIAGDTSGTITIEAPAVAGTNTLTLPASTGTIVTDTGAQTIQFYSRYCRSSLCYYNRDTNTGMFFPAADTIALLKVVQKQCVSTLAVNLLRMDNMVDMYSNSSWSILH
jgi:hypothetical protein